MFHTVVTIVCTLAVFRLVFRLVRVSGSSMLPEFSPGDYVLMFPFWPRRYVRPGHVIVYRRPPIGSIRLPSHDDTNCRPTTTSFEDRHVEYPRVPETQYRLKRVHGIAGTELCSTMLRGEPHWVLHDHHNVCLRGRIVIVPAGSVFVLGTSRYSLDSRTAGPIPIGRWIGLVLFQLRWLRRRTS